MKKTTFIWAPIIPFRIGTIGVPRVWVSFIKGNLFGSPVFGKTFHNSIFNLGLDRFMSILRQEERVTVSECYYCLLTVPRPIKRILSSLIILTPLVKISIIFSYVWLQSSVQM